MNSESLVYWLDFWWVTKIPKWERFKILLSPLYLLVGLFNGPINLIFLHRNHETSLLFILSSSVILFTWRTTYILNFMNVPFPLYLTGKSKGFTKAWTQGFQRLKILERMSCKSYNIQAMNLLLRFLKSKANLKTRKRGVKRTKSK